MPRSRHHELAKILGRVVLAYAVVFCVWLLIAPVYHLALARAAGILIPLVSKAEVQSVRIVDNDDSGGGVGAHFLIRFEGKDPSRTQYSTQSIGATTNTVVEIRQFGYPIVTFLALALGVRRPRRWPDLKRILIGSGIIFALFTAWVVVEVYQYVATQDIAFLRENLIAQLIPPALYREYRVPLIAYLGQVIPICLYGALYIGQLLRSRETSPGPREA